MLTAAVVLFLIGAVFGLLTLLKVLSNKPTSKAIAVVHGLIVVVAYVLVITFSCTATGAMPMISLILFAVAAVGGLILFIRDLSKKPGPKWLAIIHPIVAVVALLFLIIYIMGNS